MIFADTSFLVAYWREEDPHHSAAVKILEGMTGEERKLLTISDYIFDETVTVLLARTKNTEKASTVGEYLMKSCGFSKVHEHVFQEAWRIFKENTLGLSFTDCTTLALMKSLGVEKIATFDKAFEKVKGVKVLNA